MGWTAFAYLFGTFTGRTAPPTSRNLTQKRSRTWGGLWLIAELWRTECVEYRGAVEAKCFPPRGRKGFWIFAGPTLRRKMVQPTLVSSRWLNNYDTPKVADTAHYWDQFSFAFFGLKLYEYFIGVVRIWSGKGPHVMGPVPHGPISLPIHSDEGLKMAYSLQHWGEQGIITLLPTRIDPHVLDLFYVKWRLVYGAAVSVKVPN